MVQNEEGTKANLYATVGDANTSGVMLSGHTDVVPVDGQDWDTDPFSVTHKNNRLYGRGTSDMKSFVAITLAQLPKFQARGLKTPIHLAFSYDEEVGCIGVRRLIEIIKDMPVKPAMCIVGEPTSMQVITGHKGKRSYRVHVRGLEAHSSLAPDGVNAIEYASRLIAFLSDLAGQIADEGPHDELYDVPHTTVHTGTIQGGTQLNIVPKDCVFEYEFRYVDLQDPQALEDKIRAFAREELEPRMHAISSDTGITIDDSMVVPLRMPRMRAPHQLRVGGSGVQSKRLAPVRYGQGANDELSGRAATADEVAEAQHRVARKDQGDARVARELACRGSCGAARRW